MPPQLIILLVCLGVTAFGLHRIGLKPAGILMVLIGSLCFWMPIIAIIFKLMGWL